MPHWFKQILEEKKEIVCRQVHEIIANRTNFRENCVLFLFIAPFPANWITVVLMFYSVTVKKQSRLQTTDMKPAAFT